MFILCAWKIYTLARIFPELPLVPEMGGHAIYSALYCDTSCLKNDDIEGELLSAAAAALSKKAAI